jgi:hypothetical protein
MSSNFSANVISHNRLSLKYPSERSKDKAQFAPLGNLSKTGGLFCIPVPNAYIRICKNNSLP